MKTSRGHQGPTLDFHRLLIAADVGSGNADRYHRLLLDSAPCSLSLDLCNGKPRSCGRSLCFGKGPALDLTNLNPFSRSNGWRHGQVFDLNHPSTYLKVNYAKRPSRLPCLSHRSGHDNRIVSFAQRDRTLCIRLVFRRPSHSEKVNELRDCSSTT